MPRALALTLLALAASAPASSQTEPPADAPADASDLMRAAYGQVLDGQARTFTFSVSMTGESTATGRDSTFVEAGRALTVLDPISAQPRFRLDYDGGETSAAVLADGVYQIASPRTSTVYVDSTLAELGGGAVGFLLFHPAFGPALYGFAADVADARVVGPDAVGGRPCTRAEYAVPLPVDGQDAGRLTLSLCYDAETALPSEIRYAETGALDGGGLSAVVTVRDVEVAAPAAAQAFALALPEGWTREPYDASGLPLLDVGAPAPGLALADADGRPVTLADFRGRHVLIDFWGTWCGPCVAALPHVAEIAATYPDLVVLGLAAYEDDETDPVAFARARGARYPVLRVDPETLRAWRVRAFPTYVVVDPAGAVAFVGVEDRDPETADKLDAFLAAALAD